MEYDYNIENFNALYFNSFKFINLKYKNESLKAIQNGFIMGIERHLECATTPLKSLRNVLRDHNYEMLKVLKERVYRDENENIENYIPLYKSILKSELYVDKEIIKYIKNNLGDKPIKNMISNFYSYGFLHGLIYSSKRTTKIVKDIKGPFKIKDNEDFTSFLKELKTFIKKYKV